MEYSILISCLIFVGGSTYKEYREIKEREKIVKEILTDVDDIKEYLININSILENLRDFNK